MTCILFVINGIICKIGQKECYSTLIRALYLSCIPAITCIYLVPIRK